MNALVLEEPGCLNLKTIRVPEPGPGEVLVKVEAATTCGTDLKAYLRGHPQIPMPGVLGHEYSGTVASAGKGAPFAIGDQVMGVHSAPCQECRWCLRGQENLCESLMATKVLGSYAEYLLVPERIARLNLFRKPAALSFEMASLLEPLSCVAQAVRIMRADPDDRVLIIGPGAIGLMFVAALTQLGIQDITIAGRNRERLEVGEALGAKPVHLHHVEKTDFDTVIECTGTIEIWEQSIEHVRRGGQVVLFGGCASGTSVSFDTRRLHYDQITLLSPFHFGTEAVRTARQWLMNPKMNLSPLISGTRSLDEAEKTFDDLKAGRGIKYVFRP